MKGKNREREHERDKYVLGDNKTFIWHSCVATLGDHVGRIVRPSTALEYLPTKRGLKLNVQVLEGNLLGS